MKPKHTTGPWHAYSDGSKAWVKSENCLIAEMSADVNRCDADAQLIAAAPQMLEFVKFTILVSCSGASSEEIIKMGEKAVALYAQATGGADE